MKAQSVTTTAISVLLFGLFGTAFLFAYAPKTLNFLSERREFYSENANSSNVVNCSENKNTVCSYARGICAEKGNGAYGIRDENKSENEESRVVKLPVLMYHSTAKKALGEYNLYPSRFEEDLKYLRGGGYTAVNVNDLVNYKKGLFKMPAKPIMITLDDGYLTNYYYAYPLLKKYGMKGIMSVVGSFIEENYRAGSKNTDAYVDYEQIREMSESGVIEIQNHTHGLHKNGGGIRGASKMRGESRENYKKRLSNDLMRLNAALEKKSGITCSAVAFPFGLYSRDTAEILGELGFEASFTCARGINELSRNSSLHLLKRINRSGGIPTETFFRKNGIT
jgi:peptidoglycan/xylan/chitin deacetylase (PgdA/CDA1 family)